MIHTPPPVLNGGSAVLGALNAARAGALLEQVRLLTMQAEFNEMNCAARSVMRSPLTQLMES